MRQGKKALILPNDWSHVVKGKIRLFDARGREGESEAYTGVMKVGWIHNCTRRIKRGMHGAKCERKKKSLKFLLAADALIEIHCWI